MGRLAVAGEVREKRQRRSLTVPFAEILMRFTIRDLRGIYMYYKCRWCDVAMTDEAARRSFQSIAEALIGPGNPSQKRRSAEHTGPFCETCLPLWKTAIRRDMSIGGSGTI